MVLLTLVRTGRFSNRNIHPVQNFRPSSNNNGEQKSSNDNSSSKSKLIAKTEESNLDSEILSSTRSW